MNNHELIDNTPLGVLARELAEKRERIAELEGQLERVRQTYRGLGDALNSLRNSSVGARVKLDSLFPDREVVMDVEGDLGWVASFLLGENVAGMVVMDAQAKYIMELEAEVESLKAKIPDEPCNSCLYQNELVCLEIGGPGRRVSVCDACRGTAFIYYRARP